MLRPLYLPVSFISNTLLHLPPRPSCTITTNHPPVRPPPSSSEPHVIHPVNSFKMASESTSLQRCSLGGYYTELWNHFRDHNFEKKPCITISRNLHILWVYCHGNILCTYCISAFFCLCLCVLCMRYFYNASFVVNWLRFTLKVVTFQQKIRQKTEAMHLKVSSLSPLS